MIHLLRTNSSNPDFLQLVKKLDALLAVLDGEDHAFYAQFNKVEALQQVIIAYHNELPVACGAIKKMDALSAEVKRMYVEDEFRKKGIATKILTALEGWAHELGYNRVVLETGIRQPEAIALYKKQGYKIIENYGQYAGMDTSVCFEKVLLA